MKKENRLTKGMKTIHAKMLVQFFFILAIAIVLMSVFEFYSYSKKLEEANNNYSGMVISGLINNLNSYISELENITELVLYNRHIQNFLFKYKRKQTQQNPEKVFPENDSAQDFQMSMELLGNVISTRNDILSFSICNRDEVVLYKSEFINANKEFHYQDKQWYTYAIRAGGAPVVTMPHNSVFQTFSTKPECFAISRSIESYNGLDNFGVLLLEIDMQAIASRCKSTILNNGGGIFVINQNFYPVVWEIDTMDANQYVLFNSFEDRNAILELVASSMTTKDSQSIRISYKQNDYQIVSEKMDKTGWYILTVTPYENILADANSIIGVILLTGAVLMVLMFFVTNRVSAGISRPIADLRNLMDLADRENLSIRAPIQTQDEIGALSLSFNRLLTRIEQLMNQIIEEQQLIRRLELKSSQNQINPHFLYNTLDSIIWMAELKDENTVPTIEALSSFFRFSLNKGEEMISVQDEMQHIKSYLFIQSMRYKNKFEYDVCAEQDAMDCKILHLILQPLVENAIYHGIKNKDGVGHIRVYAKRELDFLVIEVSDDGIGMNAEKLQKVISGTNVSFGMGSGIGVANVMKRLQLWGAEHCTLEFKTKLFEGTTIFITLPIIE